MIGSSMLQSILQAIPRIHPEGHKFIVGFAVATLLIGWFIELLFWPLAGLTLWCALFFRDPSRVISIDDILVLSPADGRVSSIISAVPPSELGLGEEAMQRVSIFMNVFNCHINRMPIGGVIEEKFYSSGSFLNAELDKASEENERNSLIISGQGVRVGVVQIAGLIARRIVCWAREGDTMSAGDRFGLIRFGSRVDVWIPASAEMKVNLGQISIGGETVLATLGPSDDTVKLTRVE